MSAPEGRERLRRPDVRSGGFLLVVAIAYGASALGIPAGEGEPGPRALPLALAVLLAGLSTWILVVGAREASAASREGEGEGEGEGVPSPKRRPECAGASESGTTRGPSRGGDSEAADEGGGGRRRMHADGGPAPRDERVALAVLSTVAYAALFQPLGFLLATPLYAGTLASLFSRDRRGIAAAALTTTAALYLFFGVVLGVRLPPGPLG